MLRGACWEPHGMFRGACWEPDVMFRDSCWEPDEMFRDSCWEPDEMFRDSCWEPDGMFRISCWEPRGMFRWTCSESHGRLFAKNEKTSAISWLLMFDIHSGIIPSCGRSALVTFRGSLGKIVSLHYPNPLLYIHQHSCSGAFFLVMWLALALN